MPEKSLYEQVGGEEVINAVVEHFYKKVLADDRIKHFFEGVDMIKQNKMQKNFITFILGGPNNYTGRSLKAAHSRLVSEKGLNDSHFDAVIENLTSALQEFGISKDIIKQVIDIAESVRDDVLGRSN